MQRKWKKVNGSETLLEKSERKYQKVVEGVKENVKVMEVCVGGIYII